MKREILRRLIALLTLATLVLFCSCRTKQKAVEREELQIESVSAISLDETVLKGISVDSVATVNTSTITTNNDESIDIETADPDKEVTVTKEEKDGKTIWTGTNVSKISLSKNNNTISRVDSTQVNVKKLDTSKLITKKETNTEVSIGFSKNNKNINIKSTNAWVSIAIGISIILAVLLIIYLLYRKYRNKLPF